MRRTGVVLAAAIMAGAVQTRRSVVKFDGDDIDGTLTRPDGEWTSARRPPAAPPLAKPPGSFERAERRQRLEELAPTR